MGFRQGNVERMPRNSEIGPETNLEQMQGHLLVRIVLRDTHKAITQRSGHHFRVFVVQG